MRVFGFSTGAVALGDFAQGVAVAASVADNMKAAIELSALRETELTPLLAELPSLDLSCFDYVAVHAPSHFDRALEGQVASALLEGTHGLNIVLHPDAIGDFDLWRPFGSRLCIENMDKRKPIGRNCREMSKLFDQLPNASFCLDLGHARQIDPTMSEASEMLRVFGSRLRHIHLSEVTTTCRHESLSLTAILAFRDIAAQLQEDVPIIIESVLSQPPSRRELTEELVRASYALPGHSGTQPTAAAGRRIPPILSHLQDTL